MATVINGNQVRLNNGKTITANTGGWYDGQQFWGGTLSAPGVINSLSNQQGAGQAVSAEVIAASNPAQGLAPGTNEKYLAQQQQQYNPSSGSIPSAPSGSGAGTTGLGSIGTTSNLNLMDEQKKLYDASGITQLQTTIAGIQATIDNNKAEADKRIAEVNENPFLSESSRVGRIRKIDEALNNTNQTEEAKLANYNNQVTQKQNDINEKLGLQVKQFDIDKALRQENRDLFNSLLSSGALNGASQQDLSNLAGQTGLPISFIQSAIKASQKADVQIETQTDNNGNVTILTIDKQTGQIVNQVSAGKVGKGQTGSSTAGLKAAATTISSLLNANANSYGHVDPITFSEIRETFIAEGLGTRDEFNKKYAGMTSPNESNFNGVYGFDKELRSKWTTGATTATEQLIEAFNNANAGGN